MSASLVWFKRLCLSTIPFPCCSSAALFCSSYFFAWEGVFGLARASLPCRSVLPLFYPLFLATRVRPSPSPANVHRRPSPLPANVHRQQATNAHTNAPSFDAVLHTQTHPFLTQFCTHKHTKRMHVRPPVLTLFLTSFLTHLRNQFTTDGRNPPGVRPGISAPPTLSPQTPLSLFSSRSFFHKEAKSSSTSSQA